MARPPNAANLRAQTSTFPTGSSSVGKSAPAAPDYLRTTVARRPSANLPMRFSSALTRFLGELFKVLATNLLDKIVQSHRAFAEPLKGLFADLVVS